MGSCAPVNDLNHIALDGEGRIRAAVAHAFEGLAFGIDPDALTTALAYDDETMWADALGIEDGAFTALEHSLADDDSPYHAAITFLFLSGAGIAASAAGFALDMFSPEAERWGRQIIGVFARDAARNAATSVLETIRRRHAAGATPDEITARVLKAISLTHKQATSLDAFTVLSSVLNAPLRVRARVGDEVRIPRSAVDRAIRAQRASLSASQRSALRKLLATEPTAEAVEAIIDREAAAMRNFRLDAIARQESLRAVNAGQHAAYEQGVREGHISAATRRFWVTAGDERVRHTHAAIPKLNANGVGMGESFTTPFGHAMFPPIEINCRCGVAVREPGR